MKGQCDLVKGLCNKGYGHFTSNYICYVQKFWIVHVIIFGLLSFFDILELSTYILRFFRTVDYPVKIMFDIFLWCIPDYCCLSTFQMKLEFSTSVTTFQVHLNFPTSARTFQLRRNFLTSGETFQLPVLSNFARFFQLR